MSPRPRFLKLARTKQRTILEAAAEEFAARGFDGASFNKIIERAGISKGAAYYYFDDKEDLYATVFERTMEQLLEVTGDAELWNAVETGDHAEDEFWELLSKQGRESILALKPHPYLIAFFRHLFAFTESHATSKAVEKMMDFGRSRVGRFLDNGIERGFIRDDIEHELLIEITLGLGLTLDRWLFARIDDMTEQQLTDAVEQIVDLYRSMLRPRKETS